VIETLELMGGELPARALRLIREFEPLKDPALFRQVRVDEELGTVARTRATLRSSVQELRFQSPL
jgi:hypothetical protein